jgi:allantoin racemase
METTLVSLPKGPPSVETSKALSTVTPLVIDTAEKMKEDFDAIAVNCFLDPGVDELRRVLGKPVVGPCEASLALASLLGSRIGVVTVHGRALPMIRNRVKMLDHHGKVKSVVGMRMGVLDLYKNAERTREEVIAESEKLIANKHVDVVCFGCTGLAGVAATVQQDLAAVVIDPVGATVQMALAALKLCTPVSSGVIRKRKVESPAWVGRERIRMRDVKVRLYSESINSVVPR